MSVGSTLFHHHQHCLTETNAFERHLHPGGVSCLSTTLPRTTFNLALPESGNAVLRNADWPRTAILPISRELISKPNIAFGRSLSRKASFRHFPLTSYRRRAWDHAHQDQLKDAVTSGTTPDRGIYRHIADAKIREAQLWLKKGKLTIREISSRTGLSQSTVRREKCRMTDQ